MIALLAVAVVVLALLIVGWGKLLQQEIRSQRSKKPDEGARRAHYTYRHGRSYGPAGFQKAAEMKYRAKLREKKRRQALDRDAIKAAAERRGEVVEMAAHRRIAR